MLFYFCFIPDWDPSPWTIQNRMGRKQVGHHSNRNCGIKDQPVWDHPHYSVLPDWPTSLNYKVEWNANLVHSPISQSQRQSSLPSANDMTACFPQALAQSAAGLHSLFHWFHTLALENDCQQLRCFHVMFCCSLAVILIKITREWPTWGSKSF